MGREEGVTSHYQAQNDDVTLFCLPCIMLLDVIPEVVQGDGFDRAKPEGLGWVTETKNTEKRALLEVLLHT